MNEHANPATLSAQADELEERMMHELGERIATKSVLFGLADGKTLFVTAMGNLYRTPWSVKGLF